MNRSIRENTPLSLMLTDVDYFKRINDKFAHQAGGFALQKFIEKFSKSSRPYDFVG